MEGCGFYLFINKNGYKGSKYLCRLHLYRSQQSERTEPSDTELFALGV